MDGLFALDRGLSTAHVERKQRAILAVEKALMFCSSEYGQLQENQTSWRARKRFLKNKESAKMRFRTIAATLAFVLLTTSFAAAGDSPDEKKAKTRKMADKTLQELYKLKPGAQGAIQKSSGYAVFDNMGTNLLLLSTARGSGIAIDSAKQETFLKMVSGGAGGGVGVKDYRGIFVFTNEKAYSDFLSSGWSGSAQADAAAKAGESGGAYSGAVEVSPGVWVYEITKNGLALQLTLQGTKYYKDDDLNKK